MLIINFYFFVSIKDTLKEKQHWILYQQLLTGWPHFFGDFFQEILGDFRRNFLFFLGDFTKKSKNFRKFLGEFRRFFEAKFETWPKKNVW